MCDLHKYVIDVEAGEVVSDGPAIPSEGALPMELPTVSNHVFIAHGLPLSIETSLVIHFWVLRKVT